MYTAPVALDVLAAVRYLRKNGVKTVSVMGGSFGGSAAADASIRSQPGEIDRLIILAAKGNGPAERIKSPLLILVARDDADEEGLRLPRIRDWFDKAPQPKELIVLDGSAHAQFLFQVDPANRVMKEVCASWLAENCLPRSPTRSTSLEREIKRFQLVTLHTRENRDETRLCFGYGLSVPVALWPSPGIRAESPCVALTRTPSPRSRHPLRRHARTVQRHH
jgi:hypothetical protein